ncbi:hypothetical protein QF035_010403 [Streptomyces umbrinus]|uniref:Ricin B lectin domain-containing protein n=1 Tax=Streptomyces umbrinus TaxID=67370 RepID=A0ABU0TAI5_9ACTN|nr:hypothetical protein [Streptomyces umbrinus]
MEPAPEVRGAGPLTPVIQGLLAGNPAERLSAEDAERLLRIPSGEASPSAVPSAASAPGANAPDPAVTAVAGLGRNPDRGTGQASAAGGPAESPQPATTDLEARRSPGARRSKKPIVLAAAVATALLIAIAVLMTMPTEKNSISATASDGPLPADDPTPRSTDTSASATSSPDTSHSASSGATSSKAPTSPQSTSNAVREDSEPVSEGEDTSEESGPDTSVAPAGRALVVATSGKCLSSGAGTEGLQLFQAACDGSAAQRWQTGSGGTLRSSGKCMTVAGGATDDRTEIQLSGCNGNGSQRFHLAGTQLMADQSQKCLDIFGGASGTGAVLWECNGRDNQIWTLR